MENARHKDKTLYVLITSYGLLAAGLLIDSAIQKSYGAAACTGAVLAILNAFRGEMTLLQKALACWLPFPVVAYFWILCRLASPSVFVQSEDLLIPSVVLICIGIGSSIISVLCPNAKIPKFSWILQLIVLLASNLISLGGRFLA
jgi:hypothetical protein